MKNYFYQKGLMRAIIVIHDVIDELDDGYNNHKIPALVEASNRLVNELSEKNFEKLNNYFNEKMSEEIES